MVLKMRGDFKFLVITMVEDQHFHKRWTRRIFTPEFQIYWELTNPQIILAWVSR